MVYRKDKLKFIPSLILVIVNLLLFSRPSSIHTTFETLNNSKG